MKTGLSSPPPVYPTTGETATPAELNLLMELFPSFATHRLPKASIASPLLAFNPPPVNPVSGRKSCACGLTYSG
jgi:hypothetical protein